MKFFIFLSFVVTCEAVKLGGQDNCDNWYNTQGTPIKTSVTDDPVTWEVIDEECSLDYRGYRLLRQGYRQLTDKEKASCGNGLVPLGLRKINNTLVWINRLGIELEKVDEIETQTMKDKGGDWTGTFGALNLTSGFWYLVKVDHLFDCALCQPSKKKKVADPTTDSVIQEVDIDRNQFDHLLDTVEVANHHFKEEVRSVMLVMKSEQVKDLATFVKKDPSAKNLTAAYKSIYRSKVNVLNEGGRIIRSLATMEIPSSQLLSVATLGNDLIELNSNTDLDLDMDFYAQTLEINQINQFLNILRKFLKVEDNFLWDLKKKTTKIIDNIEKILVNVVLNQNADSVLAETIYMTLIVADVRGIANPVVGFTMTEDVYHYSFKIFRSNELHLITNNSTYTALLPTSLVNSSTRVAFSIIVNKNIIYPNKILRDDTITYLTPVVDIIISNKSDSNVTSSKIEYVDFMFNSVLSKDRKSISKYVKRECSYWNAVTGNWSTNGCTLVNSTNGILDVCRCNRTFTQDCGTIKTGQFIIEDWTDYGDYLKNVIPKPKNKALGYLSLIGYSLTLVGLLGILVTDVVFKNWRKELSSAILLHLSVALILFFSFLVVVSLVNIEPGSLHCIALGVVLHYSMLACFSWMLVMTSWQLVRLLNNELPGNMCLIFTITIIGWGIPLIPILTLLSWDSHVYGLTVNNGSNYEIGGPSFIAAVRTHHVAIVTLLGKAPPVENGFCYPSGIALHVAERIPIACILICNCIVFIVVLCRIYSCFHFGQKRHFEHALPGAMSGLITGMIMILMIWLPWMFGFLAIQGDPAFSYLFCIVVSTQGMLLFVLFVLVDNTARDNWRNIFSTRGSYILNPEEISVGSTTPPLVRERMSRVRSVSAVASSSPF